MKHILQSNAGKMTVLYAATTAVLYGMFWLGYYFLAPVEALGFALLSAIAGGILFAVTRKTLWSPLVFIGLLSGAIGMSMSAFFKATLIMPSRFFGLVLLIMLAYKILQLFLGEFLRAHFGSQKPFYTLLTFFAVVEVVAAIAIPFVVMENEGLLWQVFFAFVVCIFYTLGQLTLRKTEDEVFWRKVAMSYLVGFAFIFILVVLLIISMLAEDGSPLEGLFDGFGSFGSSSKKSAKARGKSSQNTSFKDNTSFSDNNNPFEGIGEVAVDAASAYPEINRKKLTPPPPPPPL